MFRSTLWISVICATGFATAQLAAQDSPPLSYASLSSVTDWRCILRHWRIRGVGVCIKKLKPHPCLKVENPWPVGVLEITPREFSSSIKEVDLLLAKMRGAARGARDRLLRTTPDASSHTAQSPGARALRFAEAHVMGFAPPWEGATRSPAVPVAIPCGARGPLQLHYASELDALGWRSELLDLLFAVPHTRVVPCDLQWPSNLHGCAGPWGAYYPRVGWATHSSAVIAAVLQAARAGRVASEPALGRVVLGPYPYPPRTGHFYQLVHPTARACEAIGSPRVLKAEAGAASPRGTYVLVHFAVLRQCIGCERCGTLAPDRRP